MIVKNCISRISASLSATMVALIVMATFVQFHHHCACNHHCSPTHNHHCALHLDAADQLRYDIDFNDIAPLQLDAATETPTLQLTPRITEANYTYYSYPLLTHPSKWCADRVRRGPPSAVDYTC